MCGRDVPSRGGSDPAPQRAYDVVAPDAAEHPLVFSCPGMFPLADPPLQSPGCLPSSPPTSVPSCLRRHYFRDEGETDAAPQAEGAAMEQVVPEPPEGTGAADMEEDGAGAEGKQTPEERARRKEEKRRRKEQKAAEKAQRKEEKKRKRAQDGADDDDDALGDMLDGDVAQDDGEGAAPAKKKTRVVDDDDDDGLFE